ncbi:hypothetical protein SDRG_11477 [Saprolegnia diclina VS20]|uniref:PX domain-containing protein n=1 Tax=Saprolegnia diclina (strain VS20) TaxID=1156394 RepID=T0REJ4_SAPDV|nr:hypothetical protein SDRG_11477 [Saprolegnia diclina VS20]EQC30718.1 hypothetical protein SDRG_11477 [Saprolegnia diclina VS20]|eukprot:XP_008615742.1 hypothetical protein SDRG_11477 [Saprolegnia diclina VS20]
MVILEVLPTPMQDKRFAVNLQDLSVHIMDYVVEAGVVYYKVEVCDARTGDAIVILRRYRDVHQLRRLFLKDMSYYCHCTNKTCAGFLSSLKACHFPAKAWFRRDRRPDVRATDLSNFLRDLIDLAQSHPLLCRANQKVVHSALRKFLAVPTLLAYGPQRTESTTTTGTSPASARTRSGSTPVPFTSKRLIL